MSLSSSESWFAMAAPIPASLDANTDAATTEAAARNDKDDTDAG